MLTTSQIKPKNLFAASFHYKGNKSEGVNLMMHSVHEGKQAWTLLEKWIQESLPKELEATMAFIQVKEPGYPTSTSDFIDQCKTELEKSIRTYWKQIGGSDGKCPFNSIVNVQPLDWQTFQLARTQIIKYVYFLSTLGAIKDDEYNGMQYSYQF